MADCQYCGNPGEKAEEIFCGFCGNPRKIQQKQEIGSDSLYPDVLSLQSTMRDKRTIYSETNTNLMLVVILNWIVIGFFGFIVVGILVINLIFGDTFGINVGSVFFIIMAILAFLNYQLKQRSSAARLFFIILSVTLIVLEFLFIADLTSYLIMALIYHIIVIYVLTFDKSTTQLF
ncbi:MAG: hypothetical protein ACXAD7_15415 [Candidatus Kariarchaeaceae archaeon]